MRPPAQRSESAAAGIFAIALAAALWAAAAAVARRLFDTGVEPLELVQARAGVTALGLSLLPAAWRRSGPKRPQVLIALGLCIALVNATYYLAIDRLAVAVAIVLQYTAPALVVGYAALSARRAPSTAVVASLLGALVGVVLISELPAGNFGSLDSLGIAFGIASAVLFASYTLLAQDASQSYSPVAAMLRAFWVAAAFWIVFQAPRGWPESLFERANLPEVLFVGVGGTLIPFLLYVWGIGRVRAERAAIAATSEPVLAAIVAWIWLDQSLSLMQLTGGALVVLAIASLQVRRREPALAAPPDI